MIAETSLRYIVFLALIAAVGGFLFGYDTAVISGTIGQVSTQYALDALAQGWYVGCALLGSILGVSIAGRLADTVGRKNVMILSALLFAVSSLGCALAGSFFSLITYRIIGGAGIGMVSIASPMYISEVAPSGIRGSLVSLYQLAITIGFLAAYLVNYQLLDWVASGVFRTSEPWSLFFYEEVWRGMLGMELLPSLFFLAILMLIPESPRWLVIRKRLPEAARVFGKLYPDDRIATQKISEVQEQAAKISETNLGLLKNPKILRPVLYGMGIAVLGQFMGVNAVLYYGPGIFEQSGLSDGDALFYQVMVGLVNVVTTILALLIIDRVGRKKLVYFGVSGMIISLFLISFYFQFGDSLGWSSLVLLVLFLVYIFSTAISISAVIFVLLSEMYPNKIRGLAMSMAGFSLWVGTFLVGQLTPWFLEKLGPSGTFLFFALMCFPYLYIIWRKIPETAGRSLEDIESYWLGDKN
jgi:sugar porter (SP) family MFS transporter